MNFPNRESPSYVSSRTRRRHWVRPGNCANSRQNTAGVRSSLSHFDRTYPELGTSLSSVMTENWLWWRAQQMCPPRDGSTSTSINRRVMCEHCCTPDVECIEDLPALGTAEYRWCPSNGLGSYESERPPTIYCYLRARIRRGIMRFTLIQSAA